MSKIRILVVEDDPIIGETLELVVEEMGYELIEVIDNGPEALRLHKASLPDLVLMDVKINGKMDGIEVATRMNESRPTPIIFITSMTDQNTFQQAKEVVPLAYLTKPFNEVSLQFAIELAISKIDGDKKGQTPWKKDVVGNNNFFIKVKNHLTKVDFDEIHWASVEGKYIEIVTAEKMLEVRIALKELEQKLPKNKFLRVHRNFLVNLDHLKDVDLDNNLLFIGERSIALGAGYRESVLKKLNLLG